MKEKCPDDNSFYVLVGVIKTSGVFEVCHQLACFSEPNLELYLSVCQPIPVVQRPYLKGLLIHPASK